MGSMIGAMRSFGQDSSVLKQKVKKGTAKRTLVFAAPYVWLLALFLVVVVVVATIGIANPLIYRQIINNVILKGNSSLIIQLAVLVVCLRLLDVALGIVQAYLTAKISAGIVL